MNSLHDLQEPSL